MKEGEEDLRLPNNVLLFRYAVTQSFKAIAESVSEDEFRETLTFLKPKGGIVQKLHKVMIKQLFESTCADFEDILNDGSLQEAVAKISKLSENAELAESENAWRPPGDVDLHLRSLDAQKIEEESSKLEKTVCEMENENAILMKAIAEKRSKVCDVHDSILQVSPRSSIALELLTKRVEALKKCCTLLQQ